MFECNHNNSTVCLMDKQLQKRFAMFLLGCIPIRLLLVYLVASDIVSGVWLKMGAILAGMIAFGFFTIFLGGLRKTGLETGGQPIWWNLLRPVHGVLWGLIAWFAWINKGSVVWRLLLADVSIGLVSFFVYHGLMWCRFIRFVFFVFNRIKIRKQAVCVHLVNSSHTYYAVCPEWWNERWTR